SALLRDADAAMYEAKERGRGAAVLFDVDMRAQSLASLDAEQTLRQALAAGELGVAYQPIVQLGERRIVALEALARLTHPSRGPIAPAHFIGIAEASGLIDRVGRAVLEQACRQAAAVRDARRDRNVRLSVNLSASELAAP